MDNVQGDHGFSGHCPVCLDVVQGISGQCPYFPPSPWTMSRESMDIVQGESGECPLSPWALSSLSGLPGLCPEYPWTLIRLSTNSMENVQGVHGHCPGRPWIQWTFYRQEISAEDISGCMKPCIVIIFDYILKGTATLIICMIYKKELSKPWIFDTSFIIIG